MKTIKITEPEIDEPQKFMSSIIDDNVIMLGWITDVTTSEDGSYSTLTVNQVTGLMPKDYDSVVKNLVSCRYDPDKEIAIMRETESNEFKEHEEFVSSVKEYAKKILNLV